MARPRGSRKQREQEQRNATGGGKLLGYVRVSTVEQGEHGHSLHGQRDRLADCAAANGFELVEVLSDVESGSKRRENLEAARARVESGEAEGILFPKLDRLGRSQLHLAELVAWATNGGFTLWSSDEGPQVVRGELRNETLPFLVALAEVERTRIRRRTKEGLAAARARGVRLGHPVENNGPLADRASELRRGGLSLQAIADTLNAEGITTARGGTWSPTQVWRMLERAERARPR